MSTAPAFHDLGKDLVLTCQAPPQHRSTARCLADGVRKKAASTATTSYGLSKEASSSSIGSNTRSRVPSAGPPKTKEPITVRQVLSSRQNADSKADRRTAGKVLGGGGVIGTAQGRPTKERGLARDDQDTGRAALKSPKASDETGTTASQEVEATSQQGSAPPSVSGSQSERSESVASVDQVVPVPRVDEPQNVPPSKGVNISPKISPRYGVSGKPRPVSGRIRTESGTSNGNKGNSKAAVTNQGSSGSSEVVKNPWEAGNGRFSDSISQWDAVEDLGMSMSILRRCVDESEYAQ
mmetsp:Transcript_43800/g.52979  ORF Transcript_43800/g.52979 Transcript_43800/m.52979 type:complete len:295 (-) Transcript_43800:215-1099(-)|eukprot:CAMPEP_0197853460 /NCGR_PEP_ID=MMETSP1438-20131217/22769_1 /TAXON_ID=1461541 /ORGANISM="Pterosperma sp., Strain CCMP1384" /LENGTH=294 /DNA_ID=CAMNT_0043467877 /DNA_START=197 /DNA_END=1081 /DNA_ORIENTATION=+